MVWARDLWGLVVTGLVFLMVVGVVGGCGKMTAEDIAAHREQAELFVQSISEMGAEGTATLQAKTQPTGLLEAIELPLDISMIGMAQVDPVKARLLAELQATLLHQRRLIDHLAGLEPSAIGGEELDGFVGPAPRALPGTTQPGAVTAPE